MGNYTTGNSSINNKDNSDISKLQERIEQLERRIQFQNENNKSNGLNSNNLSLPSDNIGLNQSTMHMEYALQQQTLLNETTTNKNNVSISNNESNNEVLIMTQGGYIVSKKERDIAVSSLERYTDSTLSEFQSLLLITNFPDYINIFANLFNSKVSKGSSWTCSHCAKQGISILNFNMGSPNAGLIIDIVSRIEKFKFVLFIGMVGGLDPHYQIGDFFIPVAAVREDHTSDYYLKPNIPAIPDTILLQAILKEIDKHESLSVVQGVVYTMNIRFWEFDDNIKQHLKHSQSHAIDMETATLFVAAMRRKIKIAAFHLVSDLPLHSVKDKTLARKVIKELGPKHISNACEILQSASTMLTHFKKKLSRKLTNIKLDLTIDNDDDDHKLHVPGLNVVTSNKINDLNHQSNDIQIKIGNVKKNNEVNVEQDEDKEESFSDKENDDVEEQQQQEKEK